MSVRLDHKLPRHPKVLGLSDRAFRLFIEALCYCDEYGTGGKMTLPQWRLQTRFSTRCLRELQASGLVEEDLSIHDYEDLNQSAEAAQQAKKRSRLSSARHRHKQKHGHFPPPGWTGSGDRCVLCSAGHGDRSRDGHGDGHVTGPTPTPTPSRAKALPPKVPTPGSVTFEGPEAQRAEELMEGLELNAATRGRIRRCGLPPGRIYAILRDTLDARPKRPGGYAWKLVTRELEGKV